MMKQRKNETSREKTVIKSHPHELYKALPIGIA